MIPPMPDFKERNSGLNQRWYDLYHDWDLIEASFAAQYGIRLRNEPEMTWGEFCTLLAGIMPETPLGQVVSIRSETDKDILKRMTPYERKIRADWHSFLAKQTAPGEARAAVRSFQEMCRQAFGGGGGGRK